MVGVRMSKSFQDDVRTWAKKQPDKPSLAPAIRRLVELGLKVKAPTLPLGKPGRRMRAQELATTAIEKMIDSISTASKSAAQRRRRLTKGLRWNFCEDRVDFAEGEGQMSGGKKSTDPGLSNNERKELRGLEAKDAIADHEGGSAAISSENRERLRAERLAREQVAWTRCCTQPQSFRTTLLWKNVRFSYSGSETR